MKLEDSIVELKEGSIFIYQNLNSFGIVLKIDKDSKNNNLYLIDVYYETVGGQIKMMSTVEKSISYFRPVTKSDYHSIIKLLFNYNE